MALPELIANQAVPGAVTPLTALNGAIGAADTPILVNAPASAPLQAAGQFRITVDAEHMLVTAGAGGVSWTVTRGVEGSTATGHANGASVNHYLTAGALKALFAQLGTDGTVGGAGGSPLVSSVVSAGSPAPAPGALGQQIRVRSDGTIGYVTDVINLQAWGAKCDAKWLSSVSISGGALSQIASPTTFTAADVGKLITVPAGGPPVSAATGAMTGATLSTAAPLSTILVAGGVSAAIPSGAPVRLTSGANQQTFVASGPVLNGAVTVPVTPSYPTFAFAAGSTIDCPPPSLATTIASVNAGTGVATLATPASQAVAGQNACYGTDDTTAWTNAIAAAQTIGGTLEWAGQSMARGPFAISQPMTLRGTAGSGALYGPLATNGYPIGAGMPTKPPFVSGSALIIANQNVDGLQLTGAGQAVNLRDFSVVFAGLWANTGHGVNMNPPAYNGFQDMGTTNARWDNVCIYGHDGNHYGFNSINLEVCTWGHLQTYGGGGFMFECNMNPVGSYDMGNSLLNHLYAWTVVGGSAHCFAITDPAGGTSVIQLLNFISPQAWLFSAGFAGVPTPMPLSQLWVYMPGSANTITWQQVSFSCNIQPGGLWDTNAQLILGTNNSFQNASTAQANYYITRTDAVANAGTIGRFGFIVVQGTNGFLAVIKTSDGANVVRLPVNSGDVDVYVKGIALDGAAVSSVTVGATLGAGGTVTVGPNSSRQMGYVTIVTGTGSTAGIVCKVTHGKGGQFGPPVPLVGSGKAGTAVARPYADIGTMTNTFFNIGLDNPTDSTTYIVTWTSIPLV